MGFVGLLRFALKCIDVLAWPLFALGYPLCASIQAIETNSNYHMRKLVTYWIMFSLISLFELALMKLIDWVPFWSYIKLIAICWLVLPRFNGAYYVYKLLLRECLSVKLQAVINQLRNKAKEDISPKNETFLALAERYIKDNGCEALEEIIANKSKGAKCNLDVEEIKAVSHMEKKEVDTSIQVKKAELNVSEAKKTTVAAVGIKEPTVPAVGADTNVKKAELNVAEAKKTAVAAVGITDPTVPAVGADNKFPEVKKAELNVAEAKKTTVAAVGIKEPTVPAVGADNKFPEVPASEKIQKEWTCALCQVTTTSETTLNFHLQGRKHMVKFEQLKASKQTAKNKGSTASKLDQVNQEPKKCTSGDGPNQRKTTKKEEKVQLRPEKKTAMNADVGMQKYDYRCTICNVSCTGPVDLLSHLNGRKHLSQVHN